MPKTLISTIYEGEATNVAIIKFSPDKVILIGVDKSDPERKINLKKSIGKLKNKYKAIKFEVLDTSVYDIPKIVDDVCKAIDKEHKLGNEITLHISEGRKTQSLGALFAGFIKKDKIKGVYYLIQETGKALPMPLLDFKLSPTKTFILNELARGNKRVADLIKKSKKSKAMIYAHINELKKNGYITEDMEITDAGRICIL
ncbi:MAG TPA: CRISPR-associated CARF protein Csa3 [Candidatus Nanoarchaeia archaeon]|nr:CRISPR locus-related DNA-binding protein [Candidatus Woesearchaeota archaeon]HLC87335.1 CRISPR-associated CARF protein Csa3 [Candidatus Nanoarchaeia archaeon]